MDTSQQNWSKQINKGQKVLNNDETSRARHVDRFNCCQVPLNSGHSKRIFEKLWIISIENGLFWFYTTTFVRKFLGIVKATCWNKLMTASPYIQLVFEKELNDLWAYEVKTIQIEELCLVCHIE